MIVFVTEYFFLEGRPNISRSLVSVRRRVFMYSTSSFKESVADGWGFLAFNVFKSILVDDISLWSLEEKISLKIIKTFLCWIVFGFSLFLLLLMPEKLFLVLQITQNSIWKSIGHNLWIIQNYESSTKLTLTIKNRDFTFIIWFSVQMWWYTSWP